MGSLGVVGSAGAAAIVTVYPFPDGAQPRPSVLVGQGMARGHLGDVGLRVECVPSANSQPIAVAIPCATVVLPDPDTPITMMMSFMQ